MSSSMRAVRGLRLHRQAGLVPAMSKQEWRDFLADVERRGILEPVQVTAGGVVLDGRHRLQAARELGIDRLPVRVVAPVDEVEYMLLAAISRRQLDPSQRAAVMVELGCYEQARSQARRRQRQNLRQHATEVATLPTRKGRSREVAAEAARVSGRLIQDALAIRRADPQLFERVRSGELSCARALRELKRQSRYASIGTPPPLPDGRFELIYADPPWQLGNPHSPHAPENHYPTLSLEQIKQLAVPAADDALLLLWVPSGLLQVSFEVIEAWGFTYKTNFAWVKDFIGLGQWLRNRHELLLLARRGNFPLAEPADRPDSVIEAPRGRHSAKPACVYQLLERMYPQASKLELFARGRPRAGWSSWGNEVEQAAA